MPKGRNKQTLIGVIRSLEQQRGVVAALAEASRWQLVDEVKRLLDCGADANGRDDRGMTALMFASNCEVARLLIERGADVNARDDEGRTPLIWFLLGLASKTQAEAYVRTLVSAGADVHVQMRDGTSARSLAETKYGDQIASLLV